MTVVSGIVLYVIVWWVVVFAVLPWGVRTAAPGDPGAPIGTRGCCGMPALEGAGASNDVPPRADSPA